MASVVDRNKRLSNSLVLSRPKPIISVNEARKLLGTESLKLTDDEIKAMLRDYEALARYAIQEYLVRK